MINPSRPNFFEEATAIRGSATPRVLPEILMFGLVAVLACLTSSMLERYFQRRLSIEVGWFELAGAAISLLLLLRTNSGYDRWWEARRLWGGIVNQCRNLAVSGLAYGPDDRAWRERLLTWTRVFPYAALAHLRGEPLSDRVAELLGPEQAAQLEIAEHRALAVSLALAEELRAATSTHRLDPFAFQQIDRERAQLMDHLGGCERIMKSPLPRVYSIKIRRLISLFLVTLPLVLLHKLSAEWLVPLVTMLVAYPFLSLDRIGFELQNPFHRTGLSPLPLDDIAATIDRNLSALISAP